MVQMQLWHQNLTSVSRMHASLHLAHFVTHSSSECPVAWGKRGVAKGRGTCWRSLLCQVLQRLRRKCRSYIKLDHVSSYLQDARPERIALCTHAGAELTRSCFDTPKEDGHAPPSLLQALRRARSRGTSRQGDSPVWRKSDLLCTRCTSMPWFFKLNALPCRSRERQSSKVCRQPWRVQPMPKQRNLCFKVSRRPSGGHICAV